ncbi:AAA-like domain protein [Mycobacterium kansasii]|uniref:AAA-like domain protein n=1 Tax=Mycobacterium kansasii TaxID=1768 RepID=A0A1V3XGK8_MYCKA|nr:AAA-like domain protein [Mycobacterium kansasii]
MLFSTFLMWVLADLFTFLPEVGDLDKPKLVFFFDEAHLLFTDASKAFLEQVEQTVKLIRSKGVGVFFCTQLPTDLPNTVLSQLGRESSMRYGRSHPTIRKRSARPFARIRKPMSTTWNRR